MMARNARDHRQRYRQIVEVLGSHGLGYLVGVLNLERFVPFHRALLHDARGERPPTRPEHLRLALEELGTTFIKLGQILSTRPDLLPPDYIAELAKLQDTAPAIPREAVQAAVMSELGRPVAELFVELDWEPVAAASIGQAHAGRLLDGTEVIVKVRRPGVVEQVEEDLEILANLANAAARRWELAQDYDLPGLAQEFGQTLRAELDYLREGRNAERFADFFRDDESVQIPQVFWQATTSRIITLERIRGMKISDHAALDEAGIDRPGLARRATRIILRMVFELGFFHADPHPGNFFVEPDGRIGLIDFGMVGTVDDRTQQQLAELIFAVTQQDPAQLVDALLELGVARRRVDRHLLQDDLVHLLSRYYGRPLGEVPIGPLLNEVLTIVRRHRLQLPPNLALLIKTAIMDEGLGAQLDPTFNLTSILAPYAEQLMVRQYSPWALAKRAGRASLDATRLGLELPQRLRRIIGELERGGVEVGVRPEEFEPVLRRFERLTNRIVLGILAAAFINGLAILMAFYHPLGLEGVTTTIVGAGFVIAAGLGAYLAWSILRSR